MRNLNINATNIEMTEAIKQYFTDKINSLDKFLNQNDESIKCSARVRKEMGKTGDIFKAEVSIHTSGKNFGAVSEKEDLYAAIDDVKDMVERKIVSYKDKKRSIFKKGAIKVKTLLKGLKF